MHWAADDGAGVELSFHGTKVSVTGPIAPDQGEIEVYLDGELIETVDLHGAARLTQQPVFTSAKLRNEEHTIRLVKMSGDVVRIDTVSYVVG